MSSACSRPGVEGGGAKARRGAGLQPAEGEPELAQRVREVDRRELAGAARAVPGEPDVDQSAKERSGRDDHGAGAVAHADLVLDTRDSPAVEDEAHRLSLPDLEIGLALDGLLHRAAVAGAIALSARGLP